MKLGGESGVSNLPPPPDLGKGHMKSYLLPWINQSSMFPSFLSMGRVIFFSSWGSVLFPILIHIAINVSPPKGRYLRNYQYLEKKKRFKKAKRYSLRHRYQTCHITLLSPDVS